jgi:hypothetical protein
MNLIRLISGIVTEFVVSHYVINLPLPIGISFDNSKPLPTQCRVTIQVGYGLFSQAVLALFAPLQMFP